MLARPVAAAADVALTEEHLLRKHIPARVRPSEAVEQPPLLLRAGDAALRLERFRAAHVRAIAAGLVRAELTRVEHVEFDQVAERQAAVQLDVGAARDRAAAQGLGSRRKRCPA